MMHVSIPVEDSVEIINSTEISPLISHCQIKVCYVGQNRNKTYFSKETLAEMGKKLPGTPIVGCFEQESADYQGHEEDVVLANDKIAIVDMTKPVGFVDINAKVWFQQFQDDDGVIREYLVTEGYIWTDIYPESERIVTKGNNQSMEIKKVKGTWSNPSNSSNRFFIINEAVIEKLCVLGEDFEPCFEGAQIKAQFSFDEMQDRLNQMVYELKETLKEGGLEDSMENIEEVVVEEPEVIEEEVVTEEVTEESVENFEKKEDEKEQDDKDNSEDNTEDEKKDEDEDGKKKYDLADVVEYAELQEKYEALNTQYEAIKVEHDALEQEVTGLRQFKLEAERAKKQEMIDGFYMLTDEDKADVVANIDTYSLDDIEAKLSVICVRNKVSFSLNDNESENEMVFNLNSAVEEDSTPNWIKAVKNKEASI